MDTIEGFARLALYPELEDEKGDIMLQVQSGITVIDIFVSVWYVAGTPRKTANTIGTASPAITLNVIDKRAAASTPSDLVTGRPALSKIDPTFSKTGGPY